ncbi:hypothetical protein ACL1EX_11405 [Corynebacterium striatum]
MLLGTDWRRGKSSHPVGTGTVTSCGKAYLKLNPLTSDANARNC